MKKWVAGLVLSFSLSSIPALAATPPKPGSVCSKLGQTINFKSKKYTCIKSGKKLVWNNGVPRKIANKLSSPTPSASPTPTTSPSPTPEQTFSPKPDPLPSPSVSNTGSGLQNRTCSKEGELQSVGSVTYRCERRSDTGLTLWNQFNPNSNESGANSEPTRRQKTSNVTYLAPSQKSSDINLCKTEQINNSLDVGRSGFPRPKSYYSSSGTVKWAFVPVDFSDLPGESNFLSRFQQQMNLASEWVSSVSERKVKLEWQVQQEWIRLPGKSTDHKILNSGTVQNPEVAKLWSTAFAESDKLINFRDIQAIHFILPRGQSFMTTAKGYIWDSQGTNFKSNEGSEIGFFTFPGVFYDNRDIWAYWVKEYVRGLGIPGIGDTKIASPFQTYDIQGSTEGERELSGWLRFLLDWIPEGRVYCQPLQSLNDLEITLVPLSNNDTSGYKLAIFPVSETKTLIIESRRITKFSCITPTERNGLLVYAYNPTLGNHQDYLTAISPLGRNIEAYNCEATPGRDLLVHEGESVTYEGLKITLELHGDFDRVRITR